MRADKSRLFKSAINGLGVNWLGFNELSVLIEEQLNKIDHMNRALIQLQEIETARLEAKAKAKQAEAERQDLLIQRRNNIPRLLEETSALAEHPEVELWSTDSELLAPQQLVTQILQGVKDAEKAISENKMDNADTFLACAYAKLDRLVSMQRTFETLKSDALSLAERTPVLIAAAECRVLQLRSQIESLKPKHADSFFMTSGVEKARRVEKNLFDLSNSKLHAAKQSLNANDFGQAHRQFRCIEIEVSKNESILDEIARDVQKVREGRLTYSGSLKTELNSDITTSDGQEIRNTGYRPKIVEILC
jgi:hypothetical protein